MEDTDVAAEGATHGQADEEDKPEDAECVTCSNIQNCPNLVDFLKMK